MREYLSQYPELNAFLKFNSTGEYQGEAGISTIYSETWEKRHIRGHGIKRYDFAVTLIKQFDTGTSSVNADEIFSAEKFMSWIDQQNKSGNLPDFGDNTKTISIENLQNMPNLAGVNNDGAIAKYMFQCRVRYYV